MLFLSLNVPRDSPELDYPFYFFTGRGQIRRVIVSGIVSGIFHSVWWEASDTFSRRHYKEKHHLMVCTSRAVPEEAGFARVSFPYKLIDAFLNRTHIQQTWD